MVLQHHVFFFFFFSSRRRHTRYWRDWSSDVCSSDLDTPGSSGSEEGGARSIRVYRWASPIEPLVRYYIQALDARRDITPDSALQRPGETSRISYHLDFYSFEDEGADSGATRRAQASSATVKTGR